MKDDTISRAAALTALNGCTEIYLNNLPPTIYKEDAVKAVKAQPSATDTNVATTQPKYDEWCTDCREYDHERHSCPRWNRVIRETVEDMQAAQSGQRNARVFQGVIVEYPSISAYPEYEGKPYFSIKYTENGQEFIGYGTYKPEVLSEYLKEYFMPPAQPGWTYIEEELPKTIINQHTHDYQEYNCLCDFGDNGFDVRTYKFGNGHFWNGGGIVDKYVTAWQPLPEIPDALKPKPWEGGEE